MIRVSVRFLIDRGVIADQCIVANCFFSRLKGLIGKSRLAPGEGLLLSPCNDIHMWFMSMPIDVVFLRRPGGELTGEVWEVCGVRENLRPWKLLPVRERRASATLELPAGTVRRHAITQGDALCIG